MNISSDHEYKIQEFKNQYLTAVNEFTDELKTVIDSFPIGIIRPIAYSAVVKDICDKFMNKITRIKNGFHVAMKDLMAMGTQGQNDAFNIADEICGQIKDEDWFQTFYIAYRSVYELRTKIWSRR